MTRTGWHELLTAKPLNPAVTSGHLAALPSCSPNVTQEKSWLSTKRIPVTPTNTTGRFELTAVQPGAPTIRRIFALFPSGVAALSASTSTGTAVLLASSFQVGISADPPLVLVAAQHTSTSWPKLRACPRIGVSVLSQEHQDIVGQLSSKSGEKLAGIPSETTHSGARFITGAVISLECSIYAETPAGDHDVILLQVHAVAAQPDMSPLIWFESTFHTLSSPHPVPESPTVRGQVNFLRTSEHG